MPKRFSKVQKKRKRSRRDENQTAFDAVQRIIERDAAIVEQPDVIETSDGEHQKDPAAVELGRRGGLKSVIARMKKISPAKRRQIAKRAAAARWRKR